MKAGLRAEKVGVFGKFRPGFLFISGGRIDPRIVFIVPPPGPRGKTELVIDVGGVLELYPSRRVVVRFDLGDTLIACGRSFFSPGSATTHNLQFSSGVGFRF